MDTNDHSSTFLYAINAYDLTQWKYIGPLVNFGLNFRPSRWSGDLGRNWEVTNFCTLRNDNISRDFLVMGTEGCLPGPSMGIVKTTGPSRPVRGQLWMCGSLKPCKKGPISGPVTMRYNYGGHLDHGCYYAANSFHDVTTKKQVVWGWITEEDLCDTFRHRQGWSGLLALPRELRIQTLNHVVGAFKSELGNITSIEREADGQGSFTIRTLASQPVQSVIDNLRNGSKIRHARLARPLAGRVGRDLTFTSDDVRTAQWELDCSFRVSKRCSSIGISIIHSRGQYYGHTPDYPELLTTRIDFANTTTLVFSPQTETFTVTRPALDCKHSEELINSASENAPHTLFTMRDPSTGKGSVEPLSIRVWRDSSVLEIFVNDRTAISTRIYTAQETVGVRLFAEDGVAGPELSNTGSSKLLYATVWDGIGAH